MVFAGIPGTGKSLWVQQVSLLAEAEGRRVHLLQWDVVCEVFESSAAARRFPPVDGVTHVGVRAGVGWWARRAMGAWGRAHPGEQHLMVVEAPLVGNRLAELARVRPDDAEALLGRRCGVFVVPAPSERVRRVIEDSRRRESREPWHVRERACAAPAVVDHLWQEIAGLADEPGTGDEPGYRRDVFVAVYRKVLRDRAVVVLPVDEVLPVVTSPHEAGAEVVDVLPSAREVAEAMALVGRWSPERLRADAEHWCG
ncbi:hypothetical protein BLA60_06085 [Actinophytocola xinjiangensis]|uniref:AAA domain-containing protein n=1 Tax=Actinophytocola xinjiangensis TaxID=485602 RepID=A0A7Z0WQX7_9PSEU|nr:hypothetical protein BLA60_06085 [Actinophytocola xinjiangensis]